MNTSGFWIEFSKTKNQTLFYFLYVTTHVVRPKLFRLKVAEENNCRTLAEMSDSCTKHVFKMRFSLIVFNLQPIHLNSYSFIYIGL